MRLSYQEYITKAPKRTKAIEKQSAQINTGAQKNTSSDEVKLHSKSDSPKTEEKNKTSSSEEKKNQTLKKYSSGEEEKKMRSPSKKKEV